MGHHEDAAIVVAVPGAVSMGRTWITATALLAGLAIGRLAAMIRIASGQAITGATIGALALAAPAWTALARRTPAPAAAPAPAPAPAPGHSR